jgi:hypothetical protein
MLYRVAGQYKTSYQADYALFPVRQDAFLLGVILIFAFVVFPMTANDFVFRALLIPVLIYALAAMGLNILTGYAGQLSLGTGAFMGVGAYSCFKLVTIFPEMNILVAVLLSGFFSATVGMAFGLPSLRLRGLYLAVSTLALHFIVIYVGNEYESARSFSAGILIDPPVVFGLELRNRFVIRFDPPSKCAALLHEGSIDVGMIPSIEYLRGHNPYCAVPDVAIVSEGPVASVAMFSRRPLRQIESIAADTSSRTSNARLDEKRYRRLPVAIWLRSCRSGSKSKQTRPRPIGSEYRTLDTSSADSHWMRWSVGPEFGATCARLCRYRRLP